MLTSDDCIHAHRAAARSLCGSRRSGRIRVRTARLESGRTRTEERVLSKDITHITPIVAGDGTELREILHPDRDPIAHAALVPGASSLRHRLASLEIYYFVAGRGVVHVDDEEVVVGPGCTVVIPAGAVQWAENTGGENLVFLCTVEPAWQAEDEEVLE